MQSHYTTLKDRVVIVTGGSRGLGREMALALAEAGAKVAVTGSRESAALRKTVVDLQALAGAGRAIGLVADIQDLSACQRAVAETRERLGGLDVLINNAGLGMRPISENYIKERPKFWEADPDAWRSIIETNVIGTFNMARVATPHMVAQGFGKVINISTSMQTMVRVGFSPYGPSKAAIESMSRIWAQDLAGTGVDLNIYIPGGATDTDIFPGGPDKRGADGNLFPKSIMRRAILWLCADESNGRTGDRYNALKWDESLSPEEAAAKSIGDA